MGIYEDLFAGATTTNPVSLSDMIFYWDRQERIVPTAEELQQELASLFKRGLIAEFEPGTYIDRKAGKGSLILTAISAEMYAKASAVYQSWHEEARKKK